MYFKPKKETRGWGILLILTFSVITFLKCSKSDDYPSDPHDRILGKWTLTGYGNGNRIDPYPSSCEKYEFRKDSVLMSYTCSDPPFEYKYWIDSVLHIGIPKTDTSYYWIIDYYYSFNGNQLTMEYNHIDALITKFIYTKF